MKTAGQCSSTVKSGTEFDIEYNKTEGVNGTATIKLSLDEVEAICTFTEEKGTCTTQKDVETDGELKLDVPDNLIEVKQDDITNSKVLHFKLFILSFINLLNSILFVA